MTDKIKKKMKVIMKEIIRKQMGCFSPGQNGWSEYVDNCIATEICPYCGNDLYCDEEAVDKDLGEIAFSGCANCNGEDYTLPSPEPREYDFYAPPPSSHAFSAMGQRS